MKQITMESTNTAELDELVNAFEEENNVKATQSYAVFEPVNNNIVHYRVLFFDPKWMLKQKLSL